MAAVQPQHQAGTAHAPWDQEHQSSDAYSNLDDSAGK